MTEFGEQRSHISREMEQVIDYLVDRKRGDKKRPPAAGAAMEGAVELYRLSLETPIDPAEMAAFKARFSELMQTDVNRASLVLYLIACQQEADRGRLDGYADACWSRSVLQIINDEFTPWNPSSTNPTGRPSRTSTKPSTMSPMTPLPYANMKSPPGSPHHTGGGAPPNNRT
ncbi:hypothetical protein SAMN02745673_02472 [Marinactinospora thermotolerans DSM 45154]|uniref:Uncharacterized protein n=1 Tax=Marinactinospora thermotolerans DSM 45154 TaxID=1122192 RepID=A0A1T4R2X5_9ACTN|nr:hypothetical protein [Marinactinospora thermotolerans]SKA10412.1 hypothetical protein SAMN02745673_02472 [Marinactinospora thermotolerans DSM 45154]